MENKMKRAKPGCGILPHLPDETCDPKRMRIRTDGAKEAGKHTYTRRGTGADYRAGLTIGNGDFGASMYGLNDNVTFTIAKNDLYWNDYDAPVPCYPDGGIEAVREGVKNGDVNVKLNMFETSNRRVTHPIQTAAGRFVLHLVPSATAANVEETLDLSSGVAQQTFACDDTSGVVKGRGFSVTANVSKADEVLRIACEAPPASEYNKLGTVRFELTRDPMEVPTDVGDMPPERLAEEERKLDEDYAPETFTDGKFFGFNMRLKTGNELVGSRDMHYTVMAAVVEDGFKLTDVGYSVLGTGRAQRYFTVLLTVVSVNDAADTYGEAKRRLEGAIRRNPVHVYINGANQLEHESRRSWIRLPDKKMSMPWYWGLYEAYSARCPGKSPAGYIAPWFKGCYGTWGYHIFTYEQTKTNLGLLATNRAELLEPWFGFLKRITPKIEKFTKDFYGMPGTCYPHSVSDSGTVIASAISLNGTIMNIATAGETVKYAWDYYDFTGDADFLRETGYPLLKNVALFYSAYLQTDEDGVKYIFPSRSQEFTAPVCLTDEFMTNSLIDLAYFRFVLDRAAKSADILGIDEELSAKWKDDLAHLRPDYATWPDGTWKTAEDTDDFNLDFGNPSVSDLTPVALTDEVDTILGSEEMKRAAEKSVRKLVPADTMPWDLSFGIIAKMRMCDKEYAKLMLELLPKCREGGFLDRMDSCQYDENNEMKPDGQHTFYVSKGGAYLSDCITEMLLQSQGRIIRLFPAYPEELGDAAFFSLRARGAFLVSAEMRDRKFAYAIIRSLKGNDCTLLDPVGEELSVRDLETGEKVGFVRKDGLVTFPTAAGHEYAVENENAPLESFPILN